MKSRDLSILVYTSEKNRDMWTVFITLLDRYWKDRLYRVLCLTDTWDGTDYGFDGMVVKDGTWYEMITEGIRKAGTPYVMLFMDDYLLYDRVDNDDLEHHLENAKRYHAGNISLYKNDFVKTRPFTDSEYLRMVPGSAYSYSTQAGIWSASYLLNRLKPEWSAWDFERRGSVMNRDTKHPLLITRDYSFPYIEGARRGKWMPQATWLLKREHIGADFEKRPAMDDADIIRMHLKSLIIKKNPGLVQSIQNLFP